MASSSRREQAHRFCSILFYHLLKFLEALSFTGQIPESIGKCKELQAFCVQRNRLEGECRVHAMIFPLGIAKSPTTTTTPHFNRHEKFRGNIEAAASQIAPHVVWI